MYDGDSRSHCYRDSALQSKETLRDVGNTLLAFMLFGSRPLNNDHALLELHHRPIGKIV